MFQNLKEHSIVYILHKDNTPYIETASVVRVSAPMPKFQMPQNFGQPQDFTVDMVIRINGSEIPLQKLPANGEISNAIVGGNVTIAASRDAMNAEITNMKQKSIELLGSIEYHKGVIESCDKLLMQLNPEFAEKQRQQEEISTLKLQMGEMTKNMNTLMEMLKMQVQDSEAKPSSKKKE